MGEYELLLREEVLHNIDRLQAGGLDAEDDDDEPAQQVRYHFGSFVSLKLWCNRITATEELKACVNWTAPSLGLLLLRGSMLLSELGECTLCFN